MDILMILCDANMPRTKHVCQENGRIGWGSILTSGEKVWKLIGRRTSSNICGKHNLPIDIFSGDSISKSYAAIFDLPSLLYEHHPDLEALETMCIFKVIFSPVFCHIGDGLWYIKWEEAKRVITELNWFNWSHNLPKVEPLILCFPNFSRRWSLCGNSEKLFPWLKAFCEVHLTPDQRGL